MLVSRIVFLVFILFSFVIHAKGVPQLGKVDLFHSPAPDAQEPIIDAIDQAKKTIHMKMFHISNPTVAAALMFAAKRGVSVKVILDKIQWKNENGTKLAEDMAQAGVEVLRSTTKFTLTHEKAMVVDGKKAMISTMNMVRAYTRMLDFGVFLTDRSVIKEMEEVFAVDWENAKKQTEETPELSNPNLIWSPVNSLEKLTKLIASAKKEVVVIVENLGHPEIANALMDAAGRGVAVRVLVPKCNLVRLNLNYPHVQGLRRGKVDARMLPGPMSEDLPYIHAKVIIVDDETTYLGSINFSVNSINFAREVGIIVPDEKIAEKIEDIFHGLWKKSELPPQDPNYTCSSPKDFINELVPQFLELE